MTTIKWPRYAELSKFYGNPDFNFDGLPDPKWEADNLVRIAPPYKMQWSWSNQPVIRIACHHKIADHLEAALREVGAKFNAEDRAKFQLDRCGGCYNFRSKRGGSNLSVHAYGAAIDLAPSLNPLGRRYGAVPNMMPMEVVRIFEKHGARWGGLWRRGDAMHFEWARD
jgi:hypothetical protein